jgi:hypothetical protein
MTACRLRVAVPEGASCAPHWVRIRHWSSVPARHRGDDMVALDCPLQVWGGVNKFHALTSVRRVSCASCRFAPMDASVLTPLDRSGMFPTGTSLPVTPRSWAMPTRRATVHRSRRARYRPLMRPIDSRRCRASRAARPTCANVLVWARG